MSEMVGVDPVALAQRGDVNAIGMLYDQHQAAILRYFRSRVSQVEVAEDLTGDVFKRMLTGLPTYRARGLPFRAWLFRIAHNLLIDHYRHETGHVSVGLDEAEGHAAEADDPLSAVEQRLTLQRTQRALAQLEPSRREVIELRFFVGLSLQETALALGKTEDSVKALQRRGLAALRLSVAPDET